jgi:hypothetical protein
MPSALPSRGKETKQSGPANEQHGLSVYRSHSGFGFQNNWQKGGRVMSKKKSVSFDAMVKFFMQHYNIPTKKDVEKLMAKMDRLETMVEDTLIRGKGLAGARGQARATVGKPGMTASDTVFEVIKETGEDGAGFAEIQDKTGFGEKKIRNIVFRLNKLGKIARKSRGIYMAI